MYGNSTTLDEMILEVNPGNEQQFVALEEQVVYRLQKTWRARPEAGLREKPTIEVSARLEEQIYHATREKFKMNTGMDSAPSSSMMQSGGSQIWHRPDAISHYRLLAEKIISNLTKKDEKDLKRLFNRDVEQLYKLLSKEEKGTGRGGGGGGGGGGGMPPGYDYGASIPVDGDMASVGGGSVGTATAGGGGKGKGKGGSGGAVKAAKATKVKAEKVPRGEGKKGGGGGRGKKNAPPAAGGVGIADAPGGAALPVEEEEGEEEVVAALDGFGFDFANDTSFL